MSKIKIILGSTRPNRVSEKLVPWINENLADKGTELEVLDLRNYPMPFYDQPMPPSLVKDGQYGNEMVRAWASKIKEADAFLIVSPEYNHGYSAVLKNALDSVYAEWNGKPIAFVSYGSVGGARAVEQLRQVAIELQMLPIRSAVHIPSPWNFLDETGAFKPGTLDPFTKPLLGMFEQLVGLVHKMES